MNTRYLCKKTIKCALVAIAGIGGFSASHAVVPVVDPADYPDLDAVGIQLYIEMRGADIDPWGFYITTPRMRSVWHHQLSRIPQPRNDWYYEGYDLLEWQGGDRWRYRGPYQEAVDTDKLGFNAVTFKANISFTSLQEDLEVDTPEVNIYYYAYPDPS